MVTNIISFKKINLFAGAMLAVFSFAAIQLAFANVTGNLLPISDGTYADWTPKSGATHYVMVDESTCNGTSDYNYTNTVGARDSYGINLSSVSNGSTITSIEVTPCASNNKGGQSNSTMDVFYRFDGADSADAGSYSLSGTTPIQLSATTFSSLSLVNGPSSSLEVGAVLSSGSKGVRLSRIAVVITYTPLASPSNLNAVNVSASQNDLAWSDNSSNELGFRIDRSVNSGVGPWSEIATTTADASSYNDTGLDSDQTYYYRVRAFNSGGNSGYTNLDYAITAVVVPSDPSDLTATGSATTTSLGWSDNSTNEEGVKVERSTDNINFTEIATKGVNAVSHIDSGLTPGTYYYRVRAFNVIGNSGYSNTASITLP